MVGGVRGVKGGGDLNKLTRLCNKQSPDNVGGWRFILIPLIVAMIVSFFIARMKFGGGGI